MSDKERLDKFLARAAMLSRRDAAEAIKRGRVMLDGGVCRSAEQKIDPTAANVTLDGAALTYKKFVYIMLNKPEGVVSATDDPSERTVLDLLPESYRKLGLFPCGRLDKNTVGLVILTDDGATAHRLLSPKSHAEKVYNFKVKFPLSEGDKTSLESGVDIGGYTTLPCKVEINADRRSGAITLTEGKYHQIKLMMSAVHNQITFLERISFAGISLDSTLERGRWREIDGAELLVK